MDDAWEMFGRDLGEIGQITWVSKFGVQKDSGYAILQE